MFNDFMNREYLKAYYNSKEKWLRQPTVIAVFLILLFPLGVYLMWKHKLWSKETRLVVSVLIVYIITKILKTMIF